MTPSEGGQRLKNAPFKRGIWDNLFLAAFLSVFAIFNALVFGGFRQRSVVKRLPSFAIGFADLRDALRLIMSMDTKRRIFRVTFSTKLFQFLSRKRSVRQAYVICSNVTSYWCKL